MSQLSKNLHNFTDAVFGRLMSSLGYVIILSVCQSVTHVLWLNGTVG